MHRTLRSTAALLLLVPNALAGGIAWRSGFEKTFEVAAAEKKVVFLAVNMDGERANDRMAEKVYRDKLVVDLSARTLNLVASATEHAPMDKDCPRFDGVRCQDHRRVDTAARKDVLKADTEGLVIAPQNVFLGPDGKVILSVPYEISADELAWCFVTALQKVDPATAPAMPASARSPRRLILNGTYDPSGAGAGGSLVPPTKKEVEGIISRLKKGLSGEERMAELRRLVLSDEPDAIDYIGLELKSSGMGGFGGGGGGGGKGGGGGGGGGRGGGGDSRHKLILRAIGFLSPPPYWEMVAEFLDDNDEALRREAAVALEQLAAPQAVPALTKALAAEKEPGHQKDLVRALGACGANDAKTRAALIKRAKGDKQALVRANAYLALGWSASDPEVKALLRSTLEKGDDLDREAAAIAVGISRDAAWTAVLETAAAAAKDGNAKAAIEAAKGVVGGAPIATLRQHVVRVGRDEVPRDRIFGRAPGEGGR
ncbi:MAG: HEAT repeat domain-containing protein [Planctomycetota bacterium]|nr:HEAT repeat domain-containing protein [Planctomycetota bacterium]